MIYFFETPRHSVIATQTGQRLDTEDVKKLCWLYGGATLLDGDRVDGRFVGPRREMVSPWSTNAVEIVQNMNVAGVVRIEEFVPEDAAPQPDPMLQRVYDGLGQDVFTVDIEPEPTRHVDDLEAFNEQEGLALSAEEIDYLRGVEKENGRRLTDSEVFGFAQINSEHCRHKIFGGSFVIDGKEMESSLFEMIKRTTRENPGAVLSAYKDNVAFARGPVVEQFAPADQSQPDWFRVKEVESVISLKAETHNFPTTVEPFNGAATGTGGEIRDRMAGGTGSWPIAGTAVYMTAYPRITESGEWRVESYDYLQGEETSSAKDEGACTSQLSVLNSQFSTLNSQLSTLNSQLSTPNSQLSTLNSQLKPRPWLYQTPEQILIKASNGASDFGNKFGQPLICGSVLTFEHQEDSVTYAYDKVIMLAGGVGYGTRRDCLKKEPRQGNKVVVVGGDNYRIGLGGGSVSSVDTGRYSNGIELNAIQRANPEMQKRAYNLVRALCESDFNPVVSIHDHGSAGHLNCLSELVEDCGGRIDMAALPIGDKTLSAKEIIANESQERMGLLVDEHHLDRVRRIAERERAPMYVVGETTGDGRFAFVQADGERPFDLAVAQMFGHSPKTVMRDRNVERHFEDVNYSLEWRVESGEFATAPQDNYSAVANSELYTLNSTLTEHIKRVLRLEAVACKDWLTNKVDRSVTGRIARQQCQGEIQLPLSDCGVVALDYRGRSGIATALGHAPQAGLASPEAGSILSVAEALTNIVWAPLADGLGSVSLSANWMWPCRSQEGEDARLYRAVKALSDFCCRLHINVPTGKDSLSMTQQYPDGQKVISPGTVIVSAGAEVSDVRRVVGQVVVNDKRASLYHIDFSFCPQRLGGSAFAQSLGRVGDDVPTVTRPEYFADAFDAVQQMIDRGWIMAGHDISAGGLVTCLLEMCFANTRGGMNINLHDLCADGDVVKTLFAENPGVVVEVSDEHKLEFRKFMDQQGVGYAKIGYPVEQGRTLHMQWPADDKGGVATADLDIDHMRDVWFATSYLLDRRQCAADKALERYENYKHQPLEMKFGRGFRGTLASYGLQRRHEVGSAAKAAIIREKGTNGEREMAYALYLAGFDVKDVTMTDLIAGRETLDEVQMIVFCGGFSNSDVLGSAKGWAGAFLYNPKAKEALDRFYARKDTLSLGICNGCQLMVELGLTGNAACRMLHNDSHKFESAFVTLQIPENNSVMFGSLAGQKLGAWVAHGEGKFSLGGREADYDVVARYNHHGYPANPNGSDHDVAGICSADGRHLAMMPHLERAVFPWQCAWYPAARRSDEVTPWIEAFVNARKWIEQQ